MNRMGMGYTTEERQVARLSLLLFLFMLVLAFIPAVKSTMGLTWGSVIDYHRDQSFVQALMEGHYGQDPTYLGHYLWYPPLITWVEAAAVALTGLPISTVIVQLGPFVNLLAPIAFFIMVWYFLGPARAALSTAVFLFLSIGQEPGYAVATYSARLIPVSFCQAFFYIELILVHRACRSGRIAPWLWAGTGAGITFLAHPAPALIAVLLIATCTAMAVVRAYREHGEAAARGRLGNAVVAGAAFLVATLPITWYIVGQYGLHTMNRAGFLFTYYVLSLHELGFFLHYNISVFTFISLAGLWLLARRRSLPGIQPEVRQLLLLWMAFSTLLFLYTYVVSAFDLHFGIHLPGIVPSFHFFFYMQGALSVFAGLAVWWSFSRLWSRRDRTVNSSTLAGKARPVMLLLALTAVAITLHYPSYATRRDLWVNHNRDMALLDDPASVDIAEQADELLPWGAVVLCDIAHSGWPMLPTARHVVATEVTFGNPYVDQHERAEDNKRLLEGMREPLGDTQRLLDKYSVTNLLVTVDDLGRMPLAERWFPEEVFRNSGYVLLGR